MKPAGINGYLCLERAGDESLIGKLTHDYEELGLKEGDVLFYNNPVVNVLEIDRRVYVFIKEIDIIAKIYDDE